MGYTHYFELKSSRGNSEKIEKLYQLAVKDCNKIIKSYQNSFKSGDIERLSGYSAHSSRYGGININGSKDMAHECFYLREHFSENSEFNFCKTAQKPYDLVVVACLAALKHRLKDYINVSSDGSFDDWVNGVNLAIKYTKLKIKNPIKQS